MIYNVSAVVGAVIFGHLSQKLGRRKGMIAALGLCLVVMPFWAFGGSVPVLIVATVVMQMGVQGAWGVIPVHLNELAADAARGLMPGLAYQLGILFAAPPIRSNMRCANTSATRGPWRDLRLSRSLP